MCTSTHDANTGTDSLTDLVAERLVDDGSVILTRLLERLHQTRVLLLAVRQLRLQFCAFRRHSTECRKPKTQKNIRKCACTCIIVHVYVTHLGAARCFAVPPSTSARPAASSLPSATSKQTSTAQHTCSMTSAYIIPCHRSLPRW